MSAELLALSTPDVEQSIDQQFGIGRFASLSSASKELLSSPYFFHQASATGNPDWTRLHALRSFFESEVGLSATDWRELGRLFLDALANFRSYSFPAAWFDETVPADLRAKLTSSGALVQKDELLHLDHQLKHDFLIATWVAAHLELCTAENFDLITFEAQSRDVLGLTLGQLDPEAGDRFLATVYDWNYPAAMDCLTMASADGDERASSEMRWFLLAVTTEKLWDSVRRSRERTLGLLQDLGEEAAAFIQCKDQGIEKLVELIRSLDSDVEWFREWQDLFVILQQPADRGDYPALAGLGWSCRLDRGQCAKAIRLDGRAAHSDNRIIFRAFQRGESDRRDATVRWRCVHALGASHGEPTSAFLLGALSDSDKLVAYGVIRALVEVAGRSDIASRSTILAGIKAQLEGLPVRVVEEFGSCVFLEKMPPGWESDVTPLLEVVLQSRSSTAEKEQWEALLAEFHEYATGETTE